MSNKPNISQKRVIDAIKQHLDWNVVEINQLVEGEESQAFWFVHCGKDYVVRINVESTGFEKDKYAHTNFSSANLIVPVVEVIVQIDENHYLCISYKLHGQTLQDTSIEQLSTLAQKNNEVLEHIQQTDISKSSGYGTFNSDGTSPFTTWKEYLLSIIPSQETIEIISRYISSVSLNKIIDSYTKLIEYCPEERVLIHADYGANNVLTDGKSITGVIDWEEAKYGDGIYDMAIGVFWAPWLKCMEIQATYWNDRIKKLENGEKRSMCYQLHIGINEISENVISDEIEMVTWLERRCHEIISVKQYSPMTL